MRERKSTHTGADQGGSGTPLNYHFPPRSPYSNDYHIDTQLNLMISSACLVLAKNLSPGIELYKLCSGLNLIQGCSDIRLT
jgi:hypothetical protein